MLKRLARVLLIRDQPVFYRPFASTWVSPSYLQWTIEPSLKARRALYKEEAINFKYREKAIKNREFFTGTTLISSESETKTDSTPKTDSSISDVWTRLGSRSESGLTLVERLGPGPSAKDRLGPREELVIPLKKRARVM
ncbi:hypothetical protein RND81_10G003000 [Saponaria officinalis]|uniref:Uncharacterized protein n=1 Tax=Saponaria officinalis TaxID=3572 RepID=A0AAW1HZ35_SAPOF